MAHSILDVKGIGKVTSLVLAKNGFKTVSDLANASIDSLALIPGFSQIRARQTINSAKELLVPIVEKKPAANVKVKKIQADEKKPKKESKKDKKEGKKKKGKKKSADKGKNKNAKKNKDKKAKQKKSAKKSK